MGTVRYLLVEVQVGYLDETPTLNDWAAYGHVRGSIERLAGDTYGLGRAEVSEVFELTEQGIKSRYGFIIQKEKQ